MSKRIGRPPKPEAEKRQQIGVRTSPELKDQLEAAAGANGRSVAQEAEFRLTESFAMDELLANPRTKMLMFLIGGQISLAEAKTGKAWHQDEATFAAARKLIDDLLTRARPAPPNDGKIIELKAERIELADRREALHEVLVACGALKQCVSESALARFLRAGPPIDFIEEPEEHWHVPNEPENPLAHDRARRPIKERLLELRSIEGRLQTLDAELITLRKPGDQARALGQALYEQMTAPGDGSAKTEEAG